MKFKEVPYYCSSSNQNIFQLKIRNIKDEFLPKFQEILSNSVDIKEEPKFKSFSRIPNQQNEQPTNNKVRKLLYGYELRGDGKLYLDGIKCEGDVNWVNLHILPGGFFAISIDKDWSKRFYYVFGNKFREENQYKYIRYLPENLDEIRFISIDGTKYIGPYLLASDGNYYIYGKKCFGIEDSESLVLISHNKAKDKFNTYNYSGATFEKVIN